MFKSDNPPHPAGITVSFKLFGALRILAEQLDNEV